MIKPNTINEFKNWSLSKQIEWIDYETQGQHLPNVGGVLCYDHFTIRYTRDHKSKVATINEIHIKKLKK